MELVEGVNLKEHILNGTNLSAHQIQFIVKEIASAIKYVHS
jgi:serine/threonine protein kinase